MVVGKVALGHIYKSLQTRGRPALSFQRQCTSRFFSSQSGDNEEDGSNNKKDEKKKIQKNQNGDAKSRLNDLLKSIVKAQEDRELGAAAAAKKPDVPVIDYKLARTKREKPPPPTEEEVNATLKDKETSKEIGQEMLSAVKTVANNVEGDPKATESELVQKLKSHAPGKINLNELFEGMKIDRTAKPSTQAPQDRSGVDPNLSRAHRVRRVLEEQNNAPRTGGRERFGGRPQHQGSDGDRGPRPPFSERQRRQPVDQSRVSYAPIDLFGGQGLGIFSTAQKKKQEVQVKSSIQLKTWDALYAKDLKSAVTHPPANGFEEMILWTEQGKLWQYPINNEQGLDQEAKVSFHEHVFLEPHIDGWCPKRGPIRHFMELVCVGLSKNPFLTVQEKKDHLQWYHEYFMGKSDIIKEVGAGEIK